jgi:hypothetical protein
MDTTIQMTTLELALSREKERVVKELVKSNALIAFIEKRKAFFETMGGRVEINHCMNCIDINWPTREQAVQCILHLPGKWEKHYAQTKITYTANIEGTDVRIYEADPPPHCSIVEEVVKIPERTIPAHEETVRKIVCHEDTN